DVPRPDSDFRAAAVLAFAVALGLPLEVGFDAGLGAGLDIGISASSGCTASSATTSSAGLSSRSPLNEAWRTLPSPVQPANSISATSSGRVQCISRFLGGLAPAANGLVLLSMARSLGSSLRITGSLNPVPTFPT